MSVDLLTSQNKDVSFIDAGRGRDANYRTNIIEMIGAPGVGKSTLYKELIKSWNGKSNWIYQEALLSPTAPSFLSPGKWIEYQLLRLLGRPAKPKFQVNDGLKFSDDNPVLTSFLWEHLTGLGDENCTNRGKLFRAAYFLYNDFCRYEAIKAKKSTKPCLIDEGFFQKSFLLHDDNVKLRKTVHEYLGCLSLPQSLIYVSLDNDEELLKRLSGRKKVIASHIGKNMEGLLADNDRWRSLFSILISELKQRNVQVHVVNGESSIADNVSYLNSIL